MSLAGEPWWIASTRPAQARRSLAGSAWRNSQVSSLSTAGFHPRSADDLAALEGPAVVVAPDAGDRPVAEQRHDGVGLVPVADQVAGAEDLIDPVGLQAEECLLEGPRVRVDIGDQSESHDVEPGRRPVVFNCSIPEEPGHRLRADSPQGLGGTRADIRVRVPQQAEECGHRLSGLRADSPQGLGGTRADIRVRVSQQAEEPGHHLRADSPQDLGGRLSDGRVLVPGGMEWGREGPLVPQPLESLDIEPQDLRQLARLD